MADMAAMAGAFDEQAIARDPLSEGYANLHGQKYTAPIRFDLSQKYMPGYLQQTSDAYGTMLPRMTSINAANQPALDQMYIGSRSAQRQADMADYYDMAPDAMRFQQNLDPERAALINELTAQAQGDLAAGRSLTWDERRGFEQDMRRAQAARGFGVGPADAYAEASMLGDAGRQRLNERRNFAGGVASMRAAQFRDPYDMITRSGAMVANPNILTSQAEQGASGAQGFVNGMFDPYGGYFGNLWTQNTQNRQDVEQRNRAKQQQGAQNTSKIFEMAAMAAMG